MDEIRFSLGSDLVIDLVDELLLITDAVLIDGTTQDGTVCALDQRQLRVEINGANSNGQGLHFTNGSEGSHVRGLVLYNFFEPVVIQSSDIQVTCNNIGVNAAGDAVFGAPPGSTVGISLHNSSNITIGGTADGQGNVIAGYERQNCT